CCGSRRTGLRPAMRWLVPDCTAPPPRGRLDWLTGQSTPLVPLSSRIVTMAEFHLDGQRLAYTVHGEGSRTTVLLPGLLLSQNMQAPLARSLAKRGNRVITLDPLGHGASSRPLDPWRYSISAFAEQTVALLDHLGIDR